MDEWRWQTLAAAFPHDARFNLTPRAYCVETGRNALVQGEFIAASRAFSSALAHTPGDKEVATEFKRSVHDIHKSRPFFQPPVRRRKQFQRVVVLPIPDMEEAPSSDDEVDDGPQRQRKAQKEFGELWMRLSRDIKEVMKREEEAAWSDLKEFLKDQYSVLKEVFQYYCGLDTVVTAVGGGTPRQSLNTEDMYTMSGLEWLEFAKDINVVAERKNARTRRTSSSSASQNSRTQTPKKSMTKSAAKLGGGGGGDRIEESEDELGDAAGASPTAEAAESTEIAEEEQEQEHEPELHEETSKQKIRPTVELAKEDGVGTVQVVGTQLTAAKSSVVVNPYLKSPGSGESAIRPQHII